MHQCPHVSNGTPSPTRCHGTGGASGRSYRQGPWFCGDLAAARDPLGRPGGRSPLDTGAVL